MAAAALPASAWRLQTLLFVVVAGLAGVVAALALPPYDILPAALAFVVPIALLARVEGRGRRFLVGWAFGLGWFGFGLRWVAIAFQADPEKFGALAVPAVTGLVIACAVFPGLAGLAANARRWRSPLAPALLFAAAWTLGEQLRGAWGLQFPWNPVATVWSSNLPVYQLGAYLGAPGLSLATLVVAGLLAQGFRTGRRGLRMAALGVLVVVAGAAVGGVRLAWLTPPADLPLTLRLVQASVPQTLKWDPARQEGWFLRHLELSERPAATRADLTIWPESAVPYRIEELPEVRRLLARAGGPGGHVITGGNHVWEGPAGTEASNSLFVIDDQAQVLGRYDKVDLVPFGEFLPFRMVLARLGVEKLTAGSFDFTPGPGRATMAVAGLAPFSPLICYEAIYAGGAVAQGAPRPSWLLNITNDAWFGESAGPYQHLAMARLRAIEEGLPLVRAANSGITAVADAFGRVRAALPLWAVDVLDAPLPGSLAMPPFARAGRLIVPGLLLLVCAAVLSLERRARVVASMAVNR